MEDKEIQLAEVIDWSSDKSKELLINYCNSSLPSNFSLAKEILGKSTLAAFGYWLRSFVDLLSLYFIGRMNNQTYLAGYGLTLTAIGIVVNSVYMGFINALDTLVSQAYGQK